MSIRRSVTFIRSSFEEIMESLEMLGSSSVSEEALKPICLAIGFLVVHWTMVDSAASICVNVGYKHSRATKDKEIPLPFSKRLKFLRKCLNTPELAHLKDHGNQILDRALDICRIRDFIVHGTIRSFILEKNNLIRFSKLDIISTRLDHEESYLEITAHDLAQKANLCGDLASDFQKLANGFIESLMVK